MKKVVVIFTMVVLCFLPLVAKAEGQPPKNGSAAVIIDVHSDRVLWGYNIDDKRAMASTTKIMTAILAIENGDLKDKITATRDTIKIEGSSIWLEEGETLTLEELLYGLMLSSGNDAAETIAKYVGGSEDAFIDMMNNKAKELGMEHTHFENPHGLPNDNHYTSAKDLGLLASYALKNETFKTITSTQKRRIDWPGHEWDRVLQNKNKLLKSVEGAIGVKTGYTKKAGRCLVAAAERDNECYVAVVLNCGPMFEDCQQMLEYAFKQYDIVKLDDVVRASGACEVEVLKGYQTLVRLTWEESIALALTEAEHHDLNIQVEAPLELMAPVQIGEKHGEIRIYIGKDLVKNVPLLATETIEKKTWYKNLIMIMECIQNGWNNKIE